MLFAIHQSNWLLVAIIGVVAVLVATAVALHDKP